MLIRLGDPPAPVPPIFAQIVNDHLAARPNMTTATKDPGRFNKHYAAGDHTRTRNPRLGP